MAAPSPVWVGERAITKPIEIVHTQGEMVSLDVQITAAEISATAGILKEAGFFDDYQLGSNSPVPADSETSETVATTNPPTDE